MRPIKTHTFKGVCFDIDLEPHDGSCDDPKKRTPRMAFPSGVQNTPQSLELVCHECLHALWFNLSEADVELAARDMSRFLWRLGYRLKE